REGTEGGGRAAGAGEGGGRGGRRTRRADEPHDRVGGRRAALGAPGRAADVRGLEGRGANRRAGRGAEAALGRGAGRRGLFRGEGEARVLAAPAGGDGAPAGAREGRGRLLGGTRRQDRGRVRAVPGRAGAGR